MTPAEPAHLDTVTPADEVVPDYVLDLERAADYLTAEQRTLLRRAWAVGAAAHVGQLRKSGEPYITHPVAVARVLAEQNVDVETLVAAYGVPAIRAANSGARSPAKTRWE